MWPWIHLCLAYTAYISPLLCLHCNWWGAYTEEALHFTLSAHCPSTHYCRLLCAKCACRNRRKSGSGQTSGECLTEVVSYTCEILKKSFCCDNRKCLNWMSLQKRQRKQNQTVCPMLDYTVDHTESSIRMHFACYIIIGRLYK